MFETFQRPEKVQKKTQISELFSPTAKVGDIPFYEYISERLAEHGVVDRDGVKINAHNPFRGTLADYLSLADYNNISRYTLLRQVVEVLDSSRDVEVFLPLSYISIMNLAGIDLSDPDLIKKYNEFYSQLDDDEKKFFKQRDEIVVLRQSPDAKKQSVVEAVSNALDALREEQIGEKGLGIKQALAFLDKNSGEIRVTSATRDGQVNVLNVKLGADGKYYEHVKRCDVDGDAPPLSGTEVVIIPSEKMSEERVREIIETIKYKFRLTLDASIYVNNVLINGYTRVTKASGEEVKRKQTDARVDVSVSSDKIVVRDNGRGMSASILSRMFIPRSGTKKMRVKQHADTHDNKPLTETYFIEESDAQAQSFNIARRAEVLENFRLAACKKLNLAPTSILIDAHAVRVPEARQSIFVDEKFFGALESAVDEIIEGQRSAEEKIQAINTVMAYLEHFSQQKSLDEKNAAKKVRNLFLS